MAHRNRGFTEVKNGWIFHGEVLNDRGYNQFLAMEIVL
jgi:hypothetical protein